MVLQRWLQLVALVGVARVQLPGSVGTLLVDQLGELTYVVLLWLLVVEFCRGPHLYVEVA